MPIDPSIPLQVRSFQPQSPIESATPVLTLLGLLQQQKLREQQMAQSQAMQPLQMDLLRAQIAAQQEVPEQRRVAAEKARMDLQDRQQKQTWLEQLASEMRKPDDATALEIVRQSEARGEPANITARNPRTIEALLAQLAPQQAATAMMRQPQNQRGVVVGPGAAYIPPGATAPSFSQPSVERREPAPSAPHYVVGVDKDGNQTVTAFGRDGRPINTTTLDTKPPVLTSGQNQQAMRLRAEYNADPNVKQFVTYGPAFTQTAKYVKGVNTGAPVSGADDIALTKLYLSLTHPKGDQISNMDLRELSKLGSLDDRVTRAITGFLAGRQLDKDTRNELFRTVGQRALFLEQATQRRRRDIEERARAMPGIDINAVFGQQP